MNFKKNNAAAFSKRSSQTFETVMERRINTRWRLQNQMEEIKFNTASDWQESPYMLHQKQPPFPFTLNHLMKKCRISNESVRVTNEGAIFVSASCEFPEENALAKWPPIVSTHIHMRIFFQAFLVHINDTVKCSNDSLQAENKSRSFIKINTAIKQASTEMCCKTHVGRQTASTFASQWRFTTSSHLTSKRTYV